jgi:signal transduction histidine kinase/CheY-like chemotaxis protein
VLRSELRTGDLEQPVTTSRVPSDDAEPAGVEPSSRKTDIDQRPTRQSLRDLSLAAQAYVLAVIAAGVYSIVAFLPLSFPRPLLFAFLLVTSCLTSIWKVNLPIPLASGSTLSVSYAADLMTLLLLGPRAAVLVAAAGVWTQCTVKIRRPYPWYRTVFSIAAEAVTMAVSGLVYSWLGGPSAPVDVSPLARPLVATIATYFVVNTGLVAAAIALTSKRTFTQVWLEDFLWSGASFMVAGTAGAVAAVVIARGEHWKAVLMIAPVYLTYRTYQVFVGRLEDRDRYALETRRLHEETVAALSLARQAENALAAEKDRLAVTVAELTRLEAARQQLLERERAARETAEEGNRLKDQFLATVSHELRTPLNAILGWADMLRRNILDESRRDRASEAIYENATRQTRLIDELLDVAGIVSGKLRLERTVVDLEQVLRGAMEVVQPAADAKGVAVAIHVEAPLSGVYGDGGRLQQIAWNLLSNAVKFTQTGGEVQVRLRRTQGAAEITVTDNGAGIPAEFLPWVFEPFRQADASHTRRYGGLGLGLSIVKHLVEAHGGSVSVSSPGEGWGATFTVRLPIRAVAPDHAQAAGTAHSASKEQGASLHGLSVLVVDDDYESREVVAAHLSSRNAVVLKAESAAEALETLRRERVDVLLADIAMPGEDGYALIRRIRALDARAASIPAAALTALAREEDRQRVLDAGFQLHLAKPIDGRSLVAAVKSLGHWHAASHT